MIEPITFTITTCDRLDLLDKTLKSFFDLNVHPIEEFIMINDSGDKDIYNELVNRYGNTFKILFNDPKIGLAKSIDGLFTEAKNEYIFHCEDDWFFEGNSNFIEDSYKILSTDKDIHQVWIRHITDLDPHYSSLVSKFSNFLQKTDGNYTIVPKINIWNGFSYNPGLRRKSDYIHMFPNSIANIGDEAQCAIYVDKFD
jgi:hypothetical protein